ncbi:MAG: DUF45 domain-containing protein [Prevotella sp.]|nr:DUF45 domain-containing protein [Prevotella sp.]
MIKITVRRTSRLSMRIAQNGDVHVSVPYGVGKAEVMQFIEKNKAWIAKAQKRRKESLQQRSDFYAQLPLETTLQRVQATQRLTPLIKQLVERYAQLMGVEPKHITFKPTISRWGCCYTRTATLCFSLYLLLLPEWCIEHVVVHELVHLLVPNHSPAFYALMDRYFPRWREARKTTQMISQGALTKHN